MPAPVSITQWQTIVSRLNEGLGRDEIAAEVGVTPGQVTAIKWRAHCRRWLRDFYRRYFNWRLVRSIGELQVLTRVSYAMLIIVPTLAGTWPAVRSVVNRFDTAAASLSGKIDNHLQELNQRLSEVQERSAGSAKDNPLISVISQVSSTVEDLRE